MASSASKSKVTLRSFRSARLQEKAAFAAIDSALAVSNIPAYWVFDSRLWDLRLKHESFQSMIQRTPRCDLDDVAKIGRAHV